MTIPGTGHNAGTRPTSWPQHDLINMGQTCLMIVGRQGPWLVVPTPLGTMNRTGMKRWFESRFRDLTLRWGLTTVFCFTLNMYKTVSALISFVCFCYAYSQFLKMASIQKLLGEKNSIIVHVWKEIMDFVVGAIGCRIWMSVLRLLIRWKMSLRPYEHGGIGKLVLLILRAPRLTIFSTLGAYISKYFTDVARIHVLCALDARTSFFIQLTHPCDSYFGSIDMFECIHLPILPQLDLKFQEVILASCEYYLRKFVLLGVEAMIKLVQWRRPE